MESKKYRFGPVVFAFVTEIPMHTADMYEKFRTDDCAAADYTVEIIPLPETSPCGVRESVRTRVQGDRILTAMNRDVIPNLSVGRLMYLMDAAGLFLQKDSFVLHASYIIRNGKALLFSAPSGTGKSTQADLWHTCRGCEIVNGDRVIISRDDGLFLANGAYVAGSSGICKNRTAPLDSIVLLEQAPQCAVKTIPVAKKLERLLCQCSFHPEDSQQYSKMMDLISDLLQTVPVFCYGCTKDAEAVEILEKYL